jgi:hypothetical protein
MMRSLYSIGKTICFPDPAVKRIIDYESNNDYKAKYIKTLVLTVRLKGKKEVTILGSKVQLENQNGKTSRDIRFYGSKTYVSI